MTRNTLDFIAALSIAGLIVWVMTLYIRSLLDHWDNSLKPNQRLMQELDRHSREDHA